MKQSTIFFAAAIFAAFLTGADAQTPPPPKTPAPTVVQPPAAVVSCPQIQLQTASQPVREGTPLKFTAVLSGGDPAALMIFSWSISSGVLAEGQGTRAITVDTAGAGADRQIVANLLIGGLAPDSSYHATATVPVAGPAKQVDEFGDLPESEEAKHLDPLISFLTQNPDRAHIFAYAGRTNVRGYASAAVKRIKAYVVKGGIGQERISAVDGGFREKPGYEIWIVPNGAESPRSTPTVDRKDIVYPKATPTPPKKP